jgi:hypothetical protein
MKKFQIQEKGGLLLLGAGRVTGHPSRLSLTTTTNPHASSELPDGAAFLFPDGRRLPASQFPSVAASPPPNHNLPAPGKPGHIQEQPMAGQFC